MEAIKKLIFDVASMSMATYLLGNFCKFNTVSITIEWDTIDTDTPVVKMVQKNKAGMGSWEDIPSMSYTILGNTDGDGQYTLQHSQFGGALVGVNIDANTAATGTITIYVMGKD